MDYETKTKFNYKILFDFVLNTEGDSKINKKMLHRC